MSEVDSGSRVVAGRYRLLGRLGTGGMGTVWRAEDTVLGRVVAVKEVSFPHGLSDEDREILRERTRREARAAARLDHPSAVTVYDVVEEEGMPYLVMEYVDARTLAEVVRTDGPLSPERTAQIGISLLGALEAAHARGIVHRDVKPGNVMLCEAVGFDEGRVVLTDFGIATSTGDSSITSTGLLLGSPSYIAPERARGEAPGPASDLWSLGATLFTAVEGRPPYDGGEPLLTVTAVVTGDHEPFVAAGPLVPVLEGLLARDPAERLSAADARQALEQVRANATALDAQPGERPDEVGSPRSTEKTAALSVGPVRAAVGPRAPARPGKRRKGRKEQDATVATPLPPAEAQPAPQPQPQPQPQAQAQAAPPAVPMVLPEPARTAQPPATGTGSPAPHRRRRGRVLPVLLTLLGLLLLGGLGYVIATSGDPGPDPDGRAAPGSPSATSSPSPSATDAVPVPAGWTTYTHPEEGWTAAVPPEYAQSERNTLTQFRDEETRRTLRIDYTDSPRPSALQAWQELSAGLPGQLSNYRQVNLEQVEFRGYDAADLEFTYTDGGADLRVLDRTFIVEGEGFALYWQTNADDFEASLPVFRQIADSFQPNG